MSKLWMYGVFHINLAFSSIPKSHYPLILDRCYWPLLDLAKRMGVPFGFEATGYSLEVLSSIDESFIRTLKEAWRNQEVEFVGAGYTQSIMPLMPAEANRNNLKIGNEVYQSLLGQTPVTAYVNEQTYASGLVDLYQEAGYQQLFMEWNNPARFHAYPAETQYRPQKALNPDGTESIAVVWNNSIAFQKLQRYLNRSLSEKDYFTYLEQHYAPAVDRGFSFYGSDAEIMDYHPGLLEAEYLQSSGAHDLQRLITALEWIQANPNMTWIRPMDFAKRFMSKNSEPIRLESPEYPLPCKKQPKYNPTRWAVSGRDDIHLNTKCYQRYMELLALQSLKRPVSTQLWRYLLEKWGSDFRTHTTDEKVGLLRQTAALLENALEDAFPKSLHPASQNALTVELWNPNQTVYSGPVTLEIQFPHQTLSGQPALEPNNAIETWQLEGVGHYQDGSVRWIKVTLWANLPPLSSTALVWDSKDRLDIPQPKPVTFNQDDLTCLLETEAIQLTLNRQKGGAIEALQFKQLDPSLPWVGTLPHGYFDDIALGADFFSGHFILTSKSGEKATDLKPATIQMPQNPEQYPIRLPIQIGLSTDIGNLWKTLYVYQNTPRIDLLYHFRFKDISAASCRVGIMTILPEAFDPETLAYCTVNGGIHPERFPLKGHTVSHSEPVSVSVSAQHGLGATDGWVSIEDKQNRVILRTYPEAAYAMPMIHYEESQPGYFLRVLPSIGEFDDTSHTLWRGHHQVMFTWMGQKSQEPVRVQALPISLSAHAKVNPV